MNFVALLLGIGLIVVEFEFCHAYPYAPSSWYSSNGLPYNGYPQQYHPDSLPSMDNPADFGHGLSNPPLAPAGYNPNYIPYSQWSVITSNNQDPYGYKSYAESYGLPPMTGIVSNGQQIGRGGFLQGLFPVAANQMG